jgi:hypothetical protein
VWQVRVNKNREPRGEMPVMKLLQSTIEHVVPDWIEQARRPPSFPVRAAVQIDGAC